MLSGTEKSHAERKTPMKSYAGLAATESVIDFSDLGFGG